MSTQKIAGILGQTAALAVGTMLTNRALQGSKTPRWIKKCVYQIGGMQDTFKSTAINHLFSQAAFTLLASGVSSAARKWVTIPSFLSLPVQIFSAIIVLGIAAKFDPVTSKGTRRRASPTAREAASPPAPRRSPSRRSTAAGTAAGTAAPASPYPAGASDPLLRSADTASTYGRLNIYSSQVQQALEVARSSDAVFAALKPSTHLAPSGDANQLPVSKKMQSLAEEVLHFIQTKDLDKKACTIDNFLGSSLNGFLRFAFDQGTYPILSELHNKVTELSFDAEKAPLICQGLQVLAQATKQKDNEPPCSSLHNMEELFTRAILKGPTPGRLNSPQTQLDLDNCLNAFNGLIELEWILGLH